MHPSGCDSRFTQKLLLKFFFFFKFCWLGLIARIIDFVISFLQPYCSLHLHLHVSANPYTSGNIASRESAPGIIVASGGWEGICVSGMLFLFPLGARRGFSSKNTKIAVGTLFDLFVVIDE